MCSDNLCSAGDALQKALAILNGKVVGKYDQPKFLPDGLDVRDLTVARGLLDEALSCIGMLQDARGSAADEETDSHGWRQTACERCGTDIEGDLDEIDEDDPATGGEWRDRGNNNGDEHHRHFPAEAHPVHDNECADGCGLPVEHDGGCRPNRLSGVICSHTVRCAVCGGLGREVGGGQTCPKCGGAGEHAWDAPRHWYDA